MEYLGVMWKPYNTQHCPSLPTIYPTSPTRFLHDVHLGMHGWWAYREKTGSSDISLYFKQWIANLLLLELCLIIFH